MTFSAPIELSEDQERAINVVRSWLDSSLQSFTVGGYAGTGKTTIISEIIDENPYVHVCAYTGKAVSVLRSKGVEDATTIHALIYNPVCEQCEEPSVGRCDKCGHPKSIFKRRESIPYRFVIVDEASMISRPILADLEHLAKKILYVGDHGQLEPVGDDPYLMRNPDIRLERIHRQAYDSPIIAFAHAMRRGRRPLESQRVRVHRGWQSLDLSRFDAILCGYNRTRCKLNTLIRKLKGMDGKIRPGERLICLRNNKDLGVFNGMLMTVTRMQYNEIDFVTDDGEEFIGIPITEDALGKERWNDYEHYRMVVDYGYALTVHKAQGSEWNRVLVIEELSRAWNAQRWRYTAATRAAKHLEWCV